MMICRKLGGGVGGTRAGGSPGEGGLGNVTSKLDHS